MSKHLIAYTDGSYLPRQTFGGAGIFAYTCVEVEKPKNYRHPLKSNIVFTLEGMLEDKLKKLPPELLSLCEASPGLAEEALKKHDTSKLIFDSVKYVPSRVINVNKHIEVLDIHEIIIAVSHPKVTNNETELMAVLTTIRKALVMDDITRVLIKTDSNYIVKSFNQYLPKWKKNSWKKVDGEEVSHLETWTEIDRLTQELMSRGVDFELRWVKAHHTSYGNNTVDLYAGIGSNTARELGVPPESSKWVVLDQSNDFKTYKDSFTDKDPIYSYNHMLFGSTRVEGDDNIAFLTTANDISGIGKRDLSSLFTVSVGSLPSNITRIKAKYRKRMPGHSRMVSIKLSLLSDKTILRLSKYVPIEDMLVSKHDGYESHYTLVGSKVPVVFSDNVNMPFVMASNRMFNRVLDIHEGSLLPEFSEVLDITDRIVINGKLNFTNMDKSLVFDNAIFKTDFKQIFRLVLGADLPNYLPLKAIEKDISVVELLLVNDSDSNFVTSYVKIHLADRVMYSLNTENKFLRHSTL